MSVIQAGNTTTTSLIYTGDTTGNLVFTTGGANTVALTLSNTQAATFAGSLNSVNTFGFKNQLINGNFDIWQRGTTNTLTTAGYTVADRWQYINEGTLSTGTVFSQQAFTVGQTAVPNNPTYFLQVQYTSVNTPSNYIRQRIENVATFSGQTVTISAWVRATSGTIACNFQFQQEFGSGGSPGSPVYSIGVTNFTATTTWQQFTATIAIPSISGKGIGTNNDSGLNACIVFPSSGSGTIQIAQAQVEIGSQATAFDVRFLGTELSMCQRYYWRQTSTVSSGFLYPRFGQGVAANGSVIDAIIIHLPTTMRTAPTLTLSNNIGTYDGSGTSTITGAINANDSQTNMWAANLPINTAYTIGRVVQLYSTTSGQFIAADAEL